MVVEKEEELHFRPTNMHLKANLEVNKDFSAIKLEENLVTVPHNVEDQGMIIDELTKIFGLNNT